MEKPVILVWQSRFWKVTIIGRGCVFALVNSEAELNDGQTFTNA